MVYYNPYNWVVFHPLYNPTNQGSPYFSLLMYHKVPLVDDFANGCDFGSP